MQNKKSTTKLSTWSKIWRISLAVIVPLGGGMIVSLFTRDAMAKFGSFNQPPLAPPAILFPIAWTILYVLMGIASYFIWKKGYDSRKQSDKFLSKAALIIYAVQLIFNFTWTPLFFNAGLYWVAFAVLMVMWILEIVLIIKAFKLSRVAGWCLLPYLLWTTFAAYLNVSIAILN